MSDLTTEPAEKRVGVSPRRIAWVLGWATPEDWFAGFARETWPLAEHVFCEASPKGLSRLRATGPVDCVVGYSLGALLLLSEPVKPAATMTILLAPFIGFPQEAGLGGRVAQARLWQLARWVRRDPAAALGDFYATAGLDAPAGSAAAFSVETLLWGVERLQTTRVEPGLPAGWRGWIGDADTLLDSGRLKALVPALSVVAGAVHLPKALL